MSSHRRVAFARARTPVAVAMRVVAAAFAAHHAKAGARRSVFIGPRNVRRDTTMPLRGCENLH